MWAKVNGTRLFFDTDGASLVPDGPRLREKPVVFLLHGGPGGDHAPFKGSLDGLREQAQLVYLDHRGSGRSAPCPAETCTLEQNIADVDAVRDYLGLDRITVLGSSYGGMVAQGYAIAFPDRLANLILVATSPSHEFLQAAQRIVAERGSPDQQRVCQRLWDGAFESLDQLREYYALMGPWYSVKFNPQQQEESWGRSLRNYQRLNEGFAGFLRTFDFRPQLGQITCPTLVLAGAHDWICPVDQSREIAARIPRAHLKVFAHSAHSIASDEPEAFLAAVRGFLTYASP